MPTVCFQKYFSVQCAVRELHIVDDFLKIQGFVLAFYFRQQCERLQSILLQALRNLQKGNLTSYISQRAQIVEAAANVSEQKTE